LSIPIYSNTDSVFIRTAFLWSFPCRLYFIKVFDLSQGWIYFSHRFFSFQYDFMGIMNHPVAYGICKSRVSYDIVPCIYRELTCNYSRAHIMPVLHDLKEVPSFFIGKGVYPPVVNNKKPYPLKSGKELYKAPVSSWYFKFLSQPGQSYISGVYALSYSAVAKSAGNICFPFM